MAFWWFGCEINMWVCVSQQLTCMHKQPPAPDVEIANFSSNWRNSNQWFQVQDLNVICVPTKTGPSLCEHCLVVYLAGCDSTNSKGKRRGSTWCHISQWQNFFIITTQSLLEQVDHLILELMNSNLSLWGIFGFRKALSVTHMYLLCCHRRFIFMMMKKLHHPGVWQCVQRSCPGRPRYLFSRSHTENCLHCNYAPSQERGEREEEWAKGRKGGVNCSIHDLKWFCWYRSETDCKHLELLK